MSLSKKHYIAIGRAIRDTKIAAEDESLSALEAIQILQDKISSIFKGDNRFYQPDLFEHECSIDR